MTVTDEGGLTAVAPTTVRAKAASNAKHEATIRIVLLVMENASNWARPQYREVSIRRIGFLDDKISAAYQVTPDARGEY
jgi:hypothetical protein